MKKSLLLLTFSLWALTGCSLVPKRVEFFQDKVHKFPAVTAKQEELQREAAALAKQKAAVVVDEALKENASPYVLAPAREVEKLTDSVSTSLGPPVSPADNTTNVVAKLEKAVAKHNNSVVNFAKENDKDAGKKIEGTGLLQIPYFAYAGGVLGFILLVWVVLRAVLAAASAANPGAAVAVGGMNVATSVLSKGFHQIVEGGEAFKDWIKHEVSDPGLQQRILSAFQANHVTAQDSDVQAVVKQLTK